MAIRHKRTTTTGYTWQASDTVEGQIGLNLTDGTLHFKKGNGTYVSISEASGGGITDLVQDTTPQLGGDLDIQDNIITTSTVNGNIELLPNGTGSVVLDGVNWPQADGTANQVLATDGAGQLSWATRSTTEGTVTSVAALTIGTTGTNISSTVANGTSTPVITLNVPNASASNRGALTSTDWSTFNGKQAALVSGTNIRTVNGSTLLGSTNLAVGTVTSVGGTGTVAGLSLSGTVTSTGNLTLGGTLSVASVTGTLAIANGGTGSTTAAGAQQALVSYTAVNGGAFTLTNTSNYIQHIFGGAAATCTLPSTATLGFGQGYRIINNSGATATINTSTAALLATLPSGQTLNCYVTNTGNNTASAWVVGRESETITGTGAAVMTQSPTITDLRETVFAIGSSGNGTTLTPNAANGNVQTITANGNFTLSAFTNPVSGQTITFIITQDATGGRTLTSTMRFAGASKTLSTIANSIDILTVSYIGTTYYATLSKGYA